MQLTAGFLRFVALAGAVFFGLLAAALTLVWLVIRPRKPAEPRPLRTGSFDPSRDPSGSGWHDRVETRAAGHATQTKKLALCPECGLEVLLHDSSSTAAMRTEPSNTAAYATCIFVPIECCGITSSGTVWIPPSRFVARWFSARGAITECSTGTSLGILIASIVSTFGRRAAGIHLLRPRGERGMAIG